MTVRDSTDVHTESWPLYFHRCSVVVIIRRTGCHCSLVSVSIKLLKICRVLLNTTCQVCRMPWAFSYSHRQASNNELYTEPHACETENAQQPSSCRESGFNHGASDEPSIVTPFKFFAHTQKLHVITHSLQTKLSRPSRVHGVIAPNTCTLHEHVLSLFSVDRCRRFHCVHGRIEERHHDRTVKLASDDYNSLQRSSPAWLSM